MLDDHWFLNAIAADRENDALRLVYADWLEDAGDTRCEYLRAMSRLHEMPRTSTSEREQLLSDVDDFFRLHDRDWAFAVARRVDVILHAIERPTMLRQLIAEIRRITNLSEYSTIDLVRGMPNTGRFRADPRRVIQVANFETAQDVATRLRSRGATISISPATELVERVNLGLGVRSSPLQAGRAPH